MQADPALLPRPRGVGRMSGTASTWTSAGTSVTNWTPRRLAVGLAAMLCASLLLGACAKELGRGRAAELVQAHEKFQAPRDVELAVGRLWDDLRNLYSADDSNPLARRGVLAAHATGQRY